MRARIQKMDLVCGIDEAGRGPIAGPVVAAAVIMPHEEIPGIRDSKKLTEKKREAFYKEIVESALAIGIGMADVAYIDEHNIRNATLYAMKSALEGLKSPKGTPVVPELVLVDYETVETEIEQYGMVKGDDLFYCISCASILAKVTRDHLMIEYGKEYPEYGLERHKGYGTKAHYQAIERYGILPIHRRSFLKYDTERKDI